LLQAPSPDVPLRRRHIVTLGPNVQDAPPGAVGDLDQVEVSDVLRGAQVGQARLVRIADGPARHSSSSAIGITGRRDGCRLR
jgi:hypothetical protein